MWGRDVGLESGLELHSSLDELSAERSVLVERCATNGNVRGVGERPVAEAGVLEPVEHQVDVHRHAGIARCFVDAGLALRVVGLDGDGIEDAPSGCEEVLGDRVIVASQSEFDTDLSLPRSWKSLKSVPYWST